jgi:hypothetical protein
MTDVTPQRCASGACEIELSPRVTLTDSQNRLPTSAVILARDSAGRTFVAANTKDRILMFDATGKLARVIGSSASVRQGTELRIGYLGMVAQLLVGTDDTVFIGHLLGPSLTALDRDLRVLPAIRSPFLPSMVLGDGAFLVAKQIRTTELIGFPMHVVDTQGRVVRSFGTDVPQYRADQRLQLERVTGIGRTGTIWAAAPGRYEFERWDPLRGTRLEKIQVKSSWFLASSAWVRPGERPNSIIVSLWEKDGVLWVLTRTADAHWKPTPNPGVERPHDALEYDRTFDWVLEAVDLVSARVIAHRRFEAALWTAAPDLVISRTSVRSATGLIVSSAQLKRKEK